MPRFVVIRHFLIQHSKLECSVCRLISSKNDNVSDRDGLKKDANKQLHSSRPVYVPEDLSDVPTNCCMSGCANCVWIQYAEKLSKELENSGPDIQKRIIENVQDPNMRAFLSMELRVRKIIE